MSKSTTPERTLEDVFADLVDLVEQMHELLRDVHIEAPERRD